MNPRHKKLKAFTLIELLVVIAIISLLVSILLPSLNKAKYLAKTVICLTNVKGQLTAFALFANDNEDRYPYRYGCPYPEYYRGAGDQNPENNAYDLMRYDYITEPGLMACPISTDNYGTGEGWEGFGYGIWGSKIETPYISGPYMWTFRWIHDMWNPAAQYTLYDNEPAWPDTVTEVETGTVLVTHSRMLGAADYHHNGAGAGGDAADKSTDTSVGFADGAAENRKAEDFKARINCWLGTWIY